MKLTIQLKILLITRWFNNYSNFHLKCIIKHSFIITTKSFRIIIIHYQFKALHAKLQILIVINSFKKGSLFHSKISNLIKIFQAYKIK